MLAARSLRLAAVRCVNPAFSVCSTNIRIPTATLLPQTSVTTSWCTRPLAAAYYSKDIKPGGSLGNTDVKLPSKEQVENFIFKSLVYLWDFTYYIFCLCLKLIDTYVFNNSTVQYYWKQLLKRMDDARKELKSK